MKNKKNIVLIGMPGSGKSTIGLALAKHFEYDFVDADTLIQKKFNMTLQKIIANKGINEFIKIEGEVNSGINGFNQIISTGGSIVYNDEAMQHLKKIGCVLYLNHTFKEIEYRLGDLNKRGVILKENQTLYDLYMERTPLYEKYADVNIRLPYGKMPVKDTMDIVIDELNKFCCKA